MDFDAGTRSRLNAGFFFGALTRAGGKGAGSQLSGRGESKLLLRILGETEGLGGERQEDGVRHGRIYVLGA